MVGEVPEGRMVHKAKKKENKNHHKHTQHHHLTSD